MSSSATAAENDKTAAKAHYEAATRLYDVHDYASALEEYKAAYLAKPDPAFLFNMGQCYRKVGKPDQALQFFRDYLKKVSDKDPNRGLVEARIRELEGGGPSDAEAAPKATALPAASSLGEPAGMPAAPTSPAATQPAGVDLSAAVRAAAPSEATPFYGTWWFWSCVGTVVVAGTVTTILVARGGTRTLSADGTLGTRSVFQ